MQSSSIQYRFNLPGGDQEVFDFCFNKTGIEAGGNFHDTLPAWTNLDFHQCPNCPLSREQTPHCPVASNLVGIVNRFNRFMSYDTIHLEVFTNGRTITQVTTMQAGISSLMGLIIAACGCPHTSFLKPMAYFHLPLANEPETVFRATSMYLLAQYFIANQGKNFDLGLNGLSEIYKNIHAVNAAIARRLRAASQSDSSVNAIIRLDLFTNVVPHAIEESLEEVKFLFSPYLAETAAQSNAKR